MQGLDEEPSRSTSSVGNTKDLTYLADEVMSHAIGDEESIA